MKVSSVFMGVLGFVTALLGFSSGAIKIFLNKDSAGLTDVAISLYPVWLLAGVAGILLWKVTLPGYVRGVLYFCVGLSLGGIASLYELAGHSFFEHFYWKVYIGILAAALITSVAILLRSSRREHASLRYVLQWLGLFFVGFLVGAFSYIVGLSSLASLGGTIIWLLVEASLSVWSFMSRVILPSSISNGIFGYSLDRFIVPAIAFVFVLFILFWLNSVIRKQEKPAWFWISLLTGFLWGALLNLVVVSQLRF